MTALQQAICELRSLQQTLHKEMGIPWYLEFGRAIELLHRHQAELDERASDEVRRFGT